MLQTMQMLDYGLQQNEEPYYTMNEAREIRRRREEDAVRHSDSEDNLCPRRRRWQLHFLKCSVKVQFIKVQLFC